MQEITKVPRTPEFVEGVINLRGKVIPVIDLRKRFGFRKTEATKASVHVKTTYAMSCWWLRAIATMLQS